MTLTQLGAFVLVARLGSVRAAADSLGVSEPAVSKAIASLRHHLGDQLIVREGNAMRLTEGGSRLIAIASQMVGLAADAKAAVAAVRTGVQETRATDNLRLVADSMIAEFYAVPLTEGFTKRRNGSISTSCGAATSREMRALVADRLADVALGPMLADEHDELLVSVPFLRYHLVVATAPGTRLSGPPSRWPWLIGPSGADPGSDVGRLLRRLRVPDRQISVFGQETAAWAAAVEGAGAVPAIAGLISGHLRRGELRKVALQEAAPDNAAHQSAALQKATLNNVALNNVALNNVALNKAALEERPCWYATTLRPERRGIVATQLLNFLTTADAVQIMCSAGTASMPQPSRPKPPVRVSIWS